MNLLIVMRVPEPLENAVRALVSQGEISPYEARSRIGGELPRIVAVLAHRDRADVLADGLRREGFETAVLPASEVEHDEDRDFAQALAFGPDELDVTFRDGTTRVVAYDAIARVIQGVRVGAVVTTREQTVKKFNATRAVLTGGLVMRSTETKTETETREQRESFAYLREPGQRTVAIYERRVNYGFLGVAREASSFANFQTTMKQLRSRAPHARFDDRLVRPYGLGVVPLPLGGRDVSEWKSDLAVALRSLR